MSTHLRQCPPTGEEVDSAQRVTHPAVEAHSGIERYCAEVMWLRGDPHLWSHRMGRQHRVRPLPAGGGAEAACTLPQVEPLEPDLLAAQNPKNRQEAFVVALAKCYMRWFLAIALRRKYCIDGYFDSPIGTIQCGGDGRLAVKSVTLRPQIRFSGPHVPDEWKLAEMHAEAYKNAITLNAITVQVHCNSTVCGP